MGMATFNGNTVQIKEEFTFLKSTFEKLKPFETSNFQPKIVSMGMSGDWKEAIAEGATLVRIGSALFKGVL